MPIVKVDESVQLEFGSGDIEVCPGLLKDTEIGSVSFFQRITPNPIGEHGDYKIGIETLLEDTPVRMTFDKIESIDVVLWALNEAKRFMQQKSIYPEGE